MRTSLVVTHTSKTHKSQVVISIGKSHYQHQKNIIKLLRDKKHKMMAVVYNDDKKVTKHTYTLQKRKQENDLLRIKSH